MSRYVIRLLAAVALVAALAGLRAGDAAAVDIQRVVSAGGIEAWLVEEHAIPIIAVAVAVPRGSYHDPDGKEGLSYLLSATLDEGAGDFDSQAFRERLDVHAIKLAFDSSRDQFTGNLETLSEFRDEAFELLALAMTRPRFDDEPVGRMKSQILAQIARDAADPGEIATRALFTAAFGPSGYGRPTNGTAESVAALTPDDLRGFYKDMLARDGMKIGVVGDVTAAELKALLDRTFGGLAESTSLAPITPSLVSEGPKVVAVEFDVPQTEIRFVMRGLERSDPDFVPAYVMNYILGGGGFNSRLYEEVREKRGLSYSVYSYLYPFKGTGLLLGGAATRADRARMTLDIIRAEIRRMAGEGPGADELDGAKKYLTGAYPLRFDSNSKIADQLVAIQIEELGIDYIDRRNALIEAVTIADVRRLARMLLRPERMIVIAVGQKQSIAAVEEGG
jgi:zinc protease